MSATALIAATAVAGLGGALGRAVAGAGEDRVRRRLSARPSTVPGRCARLPAGWTEVLDRAGVIAGPQRSAALVVVVALVALAAVVAAGPLGAVGAVVGLGAFGPLLAGWLRRRQARLDAARLPLALEEVARSLRAGRSMRQALGEAGTRVPGALGGELVAVARRAEEGVALADAVATWRDQRPTRAVRLASAALTLCARDGGEPARALDGVAATLRAEQVLAGEVRAQSAQARLSAVCITAAPIVFTGLACLGDAETAAFLFGSPAGWLCLAVGSGLDLVAALWMRRILAARP